MPTVVLDEKVVAFEGPAPQTISEVWAVIEGFLAQSGRLIESMKVDGKPWESVDGRGEQPYEIIEASSISEEENLSNIVSQLLLQRDPLVELWSQSARVVLNLPWEAFERKGLDTLNETHSLAQCSALILELASQRSAPWEAVMKQASIDFNQGLDSVIDAFERKDSLIYSDRIEECLLPSMNEVYRVLSDVILPALKR